MSVIRALPRVAQTTRDIQNTIAAGFGIAAVIAVAFAAYYVLVLKPGTDAAVQGASAVTSPNTAPAETVSAAEDLRIHIANARQDALRASEHVSAAKSNVTSIIANLNLNYMRSAERRVSMAIASLDEAMRLIQHSADELEQADRAARKDH